MRPIPLHCLYALAAPVLASLLVVASVSAQSTGSGNRNRGDDSDRFATLFPSRVKTFVKSGYDPDDRANAASQGNDDGFSGQNGCESFRTTDQQNQLAVLADFAGRPGVLGLFFRNFWSDYAGQGTYTSENNRTRMWVDGALLHDRWLTDYFRSENDPRGQLPPFSGPFTGHRSGGWFTHAQVRWNQSFRLGVWDDSFANAARFHRIAATIASPEGDLPMPVMSTWERIARNPGQWPHAAARRPQVQVLQLAPGGRASIALAGPATILELGCVTGQHADYQGLWLRATWDGQRKPGVDLPLRLLGGMIAPPYQFPLRSLLLANDGAGTLTNYFPMPFASSAVLEFENQNSWPVSLAVTLALGALVPGADFGYFTTFWNAGTTQTGVPFRGPDLRQCRGTLRLLMLEDGMDTTGRIPSMLTTHLEGDLCMRINGRRGDEHNFDASETSIGRWGWYLSPADRPFASDTSFQSGILLRSIAGGTESRRIMGSQFLFDPVHFVDGIDVRLEHGVQNTANADYALTAFLYVQPGAARVTADEIDVGDVAAERLHGVQFTQWSSYVRTGNCVRDQFYGTPAITDTVRHVRDFLRFRHDRQQDQDRLRPVGVGFRLDRLGGPASAMVDADVYVDGQPAGRLHVFTHSGVFPWKEGGEAEVELPRTLTDGKPSITIEVRPRPGSDPLRIARIWVYEYVK